MSKLGWQFQGMDGAVAGFVNSEYVKVINPPITNPFPGRKVIMRVHMDESVQDAMILKGTAGGDDLFNLLRPWMKDRPWVYAVETWNEPLAAGLFVQSKRVLLTKATVRFLELAHGAGWTVVVGNFSVGTPPIEAWVDFLPIIRAMRTDDMLGLHEYGWPSMKQELDASCPSEGWWCLRYRKVARRLTELGVAVPKMFIGECGLDRLLVNVRGGWMALASDTLNLEQARKQYFDELAWYDDELMKDGYVIAATPFTSAPNQDWYLYNVDVPLSEMLHNRVATHPTPVPAEPDYIDLVDSLPKHATLKYNTRKLSQIQRIVIHHSATVQTEVSREATIRHITAIAKGHVQNGWPGIGYHYVIGPGGLIYRTNRLDTISYHVYNNNTPTVGICMLGDFTKGDPTDNQLASARALVKHLGWPVVPHKSLNQTACPGNWAKWGHRITSDPPVVIPEPPVVIPEPPVPIEEEGSTMEFFLNGTKVSEAEFYNKFKDSFKVVPGVSIPHVTKLASHSSMAQQAQLVGALDPTQWKMAIDIYGNHFLSEFKNVGGAWIAEWTMGHQGWAFTLPGPGAATIYLELNGIPVGDKVVGGGWFEDHVHANIVWDLNATVEPPVEPPPVEPPEEPSGDVVLLRSLLTVARNKLDEALIITEAL